MTVPVRPGQRFDRSVAAAKTKAEKKSRKSMAKFHAEIRKHGRPSPRPAESPLQRMVRNGTLDVYEITAADELLTAYSIYMGRRISRISELDVPVEGPRFGAVEDRAAHESDLMKAFQQWRSGLAETVSYRVAQAVLLRENSLRSIDASSHWRSGTAKKHFVQAIRHFARIRGNVPRYGWSESRNKC